METTNTPRTLETPDKADPQLKILTLLVELNPQEPFSASRIASQSGLSVKETLVALTFIAESGEGLLTASYLYRVEGESYEIYDKDTAYRKIQSGEVDLANLWPRFETTAEFRRQVANKA